MAGRGSRNWVLSATLAAASSVSAVAGAQLAPDGGGAAPEATGAPASDPASNDAAPSPSPAPPAPVGPAPEAGQPSPPGAPASAPAPAPVAPSAPPPVAPAPGTAPVASAVNEDPTLVGQDESSTRFYLALTALGALYGHGAVYEIEESRQTRQLSGGLGYELVLLIGGVGRQLAVGGAVDFLHVPRAVVSYRGGRVPGSTLAASDIPEREHSTWVVTVGPGVDYRPGQAFRIGGTLGVAISSVPEFAHPAKGSNTVGGFGSTLWLGADWPAGDHQRFGLLIKGALQQFIPRNLEAAIEPYNGSEVSLSLGIGAGLSFL